MKVFAFLFCLIAAALAVDFISFEEIQEPDGQLVVSFLNTEVKSIQEHIDALKEVENDDLFEGYRFVIVDKNSEANVEFFADTGLSNDDFPLLFIVNEDEGVDRVTGKSIDDLREAMRFKKMPADPFAVQTVTTVDELDQVISGNKPVVIKLHEEWCGYCKQLAPIYLKAATVNDKAEFIDIECSLNNDTQSFCDAQGVKGFPTILVYYDDHFFNFNLARTVPGFSAFIDAVIEDPEAMKAADDAQRAADRAREQEDAEKEAEMAALEARTEELVAMVAKLEEEKAALQKRVYELTRMAGIKEEL